MHTLIVGNEEAARHVFLERILEKSGACEPVWGFSTSMSEPDSEGKAEIHIHPLTGKKRFCSDNLVGLCQNRRSTVYPEAFDRFAYLLENPPEGSVILMDGIGPMEGESLHFREAVLKALDGEALVLASVRDKNTDFLRKIRNHPKARCFYMGGDDEKLFNEALEYFKEQISGISLPKEKV